MAKELIKGKLRTAGVVDENLIERTAEQLLREPETPVELEELGDQDIVITNNDIRLIEESYKSLVEGLPQLIQKTTDTAAKRALRTIRSDWAERSWTVHAELEGFRANLYGRWGTGLDELLLLLTLCREMGEAEFRRVKRARRRPLTRDVILRLHARGCQIGSEVMVLLETGHADGAMARWRTMHEIFVVAMLIADHGDDLAQRYVDHEIVEAKRAADAYLRNHVALGFSAPNKREIERTDAAYRDIVGHYGDDFSGQYGWAAAHVGKKRPNFSDLESAVGRSEMRSHYKMASYPVHAGIKGITWTLGTLGDHSVIAAGATNAGLDEPGQNMAFTLTALSSLLITGSRIDDILPLKILIEQRDMAVSAITKAGRKLRREHRVGTTQRTRKSTASRR